LCPFFLHGDDDCTSHVAILTSPPDFFLGILPFRFHLCPPLRSISFFSDFHCSRALPPESSLISDRGIPLLTVDSNSPPRPILLTCNDHDFLSPFPSSGIDCWSLLSLVFLLFHVEDFLQFLCFFPPFGTSPYVPFSSESSIPLLG